MLPLLEKAMAERGVQIVLLQGARSPGELLYSEDFYSFAEKHANFRYVPCLSRELPADPHPDVQHGYVQQALAGFTPDPATDIAYLCGNPDMVDACAELLKAAGLGNPQIRREKYVSSSSGRAGRWPATREPEAAPCRPRCLPQYATQASRQA